MHSRSRKIVIAIWSGILGLLITGVVQGAWGALFVTNLRTTPSIPWSAAPMAFFLWLMWRYLGGKGWPRSTSKSRENYLRARPVSRQTFGWALLSGVLSIVALAGYWIVLFQLVKMPANVLPDISRYPWWTIAFLAVMASVVSPLCEEAGFRGYCQGMLEREFRGPVAVGISAVFFALAHVTQGLLWPKLLVYFFAGVVFGSIAYFTKSILPALVVHVLADLTFFSSVWPFDVGRALVTESGADGWFWIHVGQAVVFTGLAIWAFRRLAQQGVHMSVNAARMSACATAVI